MVDDEKSRDITRNYIHLWVLLAFCFHIFFDLNLNLFVFLINAFVIQSIVVGFSYRILITFKLTPATILDYKDVNEKREKKNIKIMSQQQQQQQHQHLKRPFSTYYIAAFWLLINEEMLLLYRTVCCCLPYWGIDLHNKNIIINEIISLLVIFYKVVSSTIEQRAPKKNARKLHSVFRFCCCCYCCCYFFCKKTNIILMKFVLILD